MMCREFINQAFHDNYAKNVAFVWLGGGENGGYWI